MSSTYSTRIRLEKQGSGENANTWGDILNANVIELADEAIAGYTVVSVSAGEEILTANNGTVDQSRNATLEIAGTLTDNVTVVIPAKEKTYFIRENTTGSFNTFLKTAGGTAVGIQQGTNIMVATDGTTIVTSGETSVANFTANALTVTGNVSVATLVASGNVSVNSAAVTGNVSVASVVASGSITAATLVGNGAGITGLNILPTGAVLPYGGMGAPSGFVLADGASLSRTTYAALFAIFGTQYGTADASTFRVPDLRGRVVAGYDSMGGSSADRLTNFTGGVNGDVLGGFGGLESCLLTGAMSGVAAHTHLYNKVVINAVDGSTGDVGFSTDRPISAATEENNTADAAQAHNNVQPTLILTFIIKT